MATMLEFSLGKKCNLLNKPGRLCQGFASSGPVIWSEAWLENTDRESAGAVLPLQS